MNKYYQIVPVNDGYNRLAYSRIGDKHYLQRKEMPYNDDSLFFYNTIAAEIYMKVYKFNPKDYEIEECWKA